jgi:hypothetical protein
MRLLQPKFRYFIQQLVTLLTESFQTGLRTNLYRVFRLQRKQKSCATTQKRNRNQVQLRCDGLSQLFRDTSQVHAGY